MVKLDELTKKEVNDLIEQRRLEMSFMFSNQFTFCLGQKIESKPIQIIERKH